MASRPGWAADRPTSKLTDYFPPPEEQSGWRTLLPSEGEPDDSQKAQVRSVGGMNWDALKAAGVPGANIGEVERQEVLQITSREKRVVKEMKLVEEAGRGPAKERVGDNAAVPEIKAVSPKEGEASPPR